MIINYGPQSNAADFRPETLQFVAWDDGFPTWAETPIDLVVTMTIKDGRGCQIVSGKSGDGSDIVTIRENGIVDIMVSASKMAAFRRGRHVLFLKTETDGYVNEAVIGYLPIYEGA